MLYAEELNLTKNNIGLLSEDHVFRYIQFETDLEISEMVSGIFDSCNFQKIDFYWTLFNLARFINCRFDNVKFRGVNFSECIFVNCEFELCKFIPANVGEGCKYIGNIWHSVKFIDCQNPPSTNP